MSSGVQKCTPRTPPGLFFRIEGVLPVYVIVYISMSFEHDRCNRTPMFTRGSPVWLTKNFACKIIESLRKRFTPIGLTVFPGRVVNWRMSDGEGECRTRLILIDIQV